MGKAMFSPTDGFVELVRRAYFEGKQEERENVEVPANPEELWRIFLFSMFTGNLRKGAQVNYAVRILKGFLDLSQARRANTSSTWTRDIKREIDRVLKTLKHTPPDGLRKAVLESVREEADDGSLVRMASGMADYIDNRLDTKLLSSVRGNFDAEYKFVHDAIDGGGIPYVGPTRFFLWMHACNSGWTLTAPSGPVRWALTSQDLGFQGTISPSWRVSTGSDIDVSALTAFGELCTMYVKLTEELKSIADLSLTPDDVQSAAWYLGTTHAILSNDPRARSRLTAANLVKFLDRQSWSLDDYWDRIGNLDKLDAVTRELRLIL